MAREKRKVVEITIVSPRSGQVFKLGTAPVETDPIVLQARITEDDLDISQKVEVSWKLKLSWHATYNTYQTKFEITGIPTSTNLQSCGILRIRASVNVDGREYSTRTRVNIIGMNPSKEQLIKALDSDLLRAQAFVESTWKQFDMNGQPLLNPDSSMRGLMQISERWWGEKSPLSLKDFNRIAWQWDYNIKTAKLILDHYYKQAKNIFPRENEKRLWDRALKAYRTGPNFKYKTDPSKHPYVKKIREYMRSKPWERF
ncbi:MAG: transglycosylase SLT domain-containing protein [Candidatus Hadarchaeum sp.]